MLRSPTAQTGLGFEKIVWTGNLISNIPSKSPLYIISPGAFLTCFSYLMNFVCN